MTTSESTDAAGELPLTSAASGCLYASFVVVVSAGLLFVNALFCWTVYAVFPKPADENVAARIGQMFFFIVPVLMLVIEWHLLDRIQRLFRKSG